MDDDPFRWCVYCGADCYPNAAVHRDDCPVLTGVWVVRADEVMPCPHCGQSMHSARCMDCHAPLAVGDRYALRDVTTGQVSVRPEIGDVICLGCAARIGLLKKAMNGESE